MFAPASNVLEVENTYLSTGMTLVATCVESLRNLQTEDKFCDKWDKIVTQIDAHSGRTRRDNTLLQDYVVEETTGNNEMNKDEMRRLFYCILDQVIDDINVRFSHQNTKLHAAVSTLQHENSNFFNVKMVQLLLDLVDHTSAKAKFDVAKTYVAKLNGDKKTKPKTTKLLSEYCEEL